MRILFEGNNDGQRGLRPAAISTVLRRLALVDRDGPVSETIRVRRRLSGGRSGCHVFEVLCESGNNSVPRVVKVGPYHELRDEFHNWRALQSPSSLFVPIIAATPAIASRGEHMPPDDYEAVMYYHAAAFGGLLHTEASTFEQLVRDSFEGRVPVERVTACIAKVFAGIHHTLYGNYLREKADLADAYSLRLGEAAVLEVDRVDGNVLLRGPVTPEDRKRARREPDDLVTAAIQTEPGKREIQVGDLIELRDLTATWWDDRLMGVFKDPLSRIEVVAVGDAPTRSLGPLPREGERFSVCGRVRSLRADERASRLTAGLSECQVTSTQVFGKSESTWNPFVDLPKILKTQRLRLTSHAHGDLNPRNILLCADQPYLIDFAFTGKGQPLLMDFARLEGLVTRELLPPAFTWDDHVRLQRMLALVTYIGPDAVKPLAQGVQGQSLLDQSFRILAAIRCAARSAWPKDFEEAFPVDLLEHLFLFAHLTLKWPFDPARQGADARAMAALAAVAVESMDKALAVRRLSTDSVKQAGLPLASLLAGMPLQEAAPLGAALARRMDALTERIEVRKAIEGELTQLGRRLVLERYTGEAAQLLADRLTETKTFVRLTAFMDLRAELHQASANERRLPALDLDEEHSFERLLTDEAAIVNSERLRITRGADEDVVGLLEQQDRLVLLGDAGAGKTSTARFWSYQLAIAIQRQAKGRLRMPLSFTARDLVARLRSTTDEVGRAELGIDEDSLALGVIHVTIDGLNEVPTEQRRLVAKWITALGELFPRVGLVVTHRLYNWVPGLLPYPVATLQKLTADQARTYIRDYLAAHDGPDHAQHATALTRLLLDDEARESLRDLARTPLFLWMVVEHFRETREMPDGRGSLFRRFARWYLSEEWHARTGEARPSDAEIVEREALLSKLGFALVEAGKTEMDRADAAWADTSQGRVLDAVLKSEILEDSDGAIRFFHQSFQEYFAARYFLAVEAQDEALLERRIKTFRWHDAFVLIVGFAGENPDVSTKVISRALRYDPILTARCLRMGEGLDPGVVKQFVADQVSTLCDMGVADSERRLASTALAEFGQRTALDALMDVLRDAQTPEVARIIALEELAALPSQVRFESLRQELTGKLSEVVEHLLASTQSESMRTAAIKAIRVARLDALSLYVADELDGSSGWAVCREASSAAEDLKLKLTRRQQAALIQAARARLGALEQELSATGVRKEAERLNGERKEILRLLTHKDGVAALPLLLERRFVPWMDRDVADLITNLVTSPEPRGIPAMAERAWAILTKAEQLSAKQLLKLVQNSSVDDLTAAAAACQLEDAVNAPVRLERHKKQGLLSAQALAKLVSSLKVLSCKRLAQLLVALRRHRWFDEDMANSVEETILAAVAKAKDTQDSEAVAAALLALSNINPGSARRTAAMLDVSITSYPYCLLTLSLSLAPGDFEIMLSRGGDWQEAAIYALAAHGGGHQVKAEYCPHLLNLSVSTLAYFEALEPRDEDAGNYARACAQVKAFSKLPWMVQVARRTETWSTLVVVLHHNAYGDFPNTQVASVLRAIGALARTARDQGMQALADEATNALREWYATRQSTQRTNIVALVTGLAYLGEWQQVLEQLREGEPWLHDTAQSVFEYWIPKGEQGNPAREQALSWVTERLKSPSLPADVRDTLVKLRRHLAEALGHF